MLRISEKNLQVMKRILITYLMKEFCSITFSDKHNSSNRNYRFSSRAGSAHSQVLFSSSPKGPLFNFRVKVKNDYIKKPLEIKRGFLVYVYDLLICCVLESLPC